MKALCGDRYRGLCLVVFFCLVGYEKWGRCNLLSHLGGCLSTESPICLPGAISRVVAGSPCTIITQYIYRYGYYYWCFIVIITVYSKNYESLWAEACTKSNWNHGVSAWRQSLISKNIKDPQRQLKPLEGEVSHCQAMSPVMARHFMKTAFYNKLVTNAAVVWEYIYMHLFDISKVPSWTKDL